MANPKKAAAKTAVAVPAKPAAPAKPAPAAKPAAAKKPVKAAAKPKAAAKAAPKVPAQAKAAVKPTPKSKPAAAPKADKPAKEKKPKLVRDSFTIPKAEYALLEDLKARAGKLGRPVKKSELLRAGIKALGAMGDVEYVKALAAVPAIKTGRPATGA